ncbi:hypothetical protein HNP40_002172 [Mycobacteroides chelonae]|nr:hypothetical protein [Mycobacteroides chelonae]
MSPAVAAASLPTRSQIESWQTDHLSQASVRWNAAAAQIEQLSSQHARNVEAPAGTLWTGQSAETASGQVSSDHKLALSQADTLRSAATTARIGAEDLAAIKANALDAVAQAEREGFHVAQDLSVTDARPKKSGANEHGREQAAAEHQTFIRWRASQLHQADQNIARSLDGNTSDLDKHKAGSRNGTVHMFDDGHGTPGGGPAPTNPSAALGLPDYPPGTLSNEESRTVYTRGELKMKELDAQWARQGVPLEERAKRMFEMRNGLRTWSRTLMSDRPLADFLNQNERNRTFDQMVNNGRVKGLSGPQIYQDIIESATRSRDSVNAGLGIDPKSPPQLPPVRGAGPPPSLPTELKPEGGGLISAPGASEGIPQQLHPSGPDHMPKVEGTFGDKTIEDP